FRAENLDNHDGGAGNRGGEKNVAAQSRRKGRLRRRRCSGFHGRGFWGVHFFPMRDRMKVVERSARASLNGWGAGPWVHFDTTTGARAVPGSQHIGQSTLWRISWGVLAVPNPLRARDGSRSGATRGFGSWVGVARCTPGPVA